MNQAAQATIKAPAPRVFYLAMDDVYESAIADAWAKQHGKSLVKHIPLERLTMEMVIVPVVRPYETKTPMLQEVWDPSEQLKKSRRVPAAELTGELVECKPVRVSDFWTGSPGRTSTDAFAELLMGKLDTSGFVNALGESTLAQGVHPRTHHGEDNKILKLTWGA